MDVGQSQLFTSSVINGTSPYSYQWYQWLPNGSKPFTGATEATFNFTPSSAGFNLIYVEITDRLGVKVDVEAAATVNPLLSASISPSPVTISVGQSQTFNSSVSGGTSPYSYQWYLNGALVSGATNSTLTFTPRSAGSYMVYVEVADSVGVKATSNTAIATVKLHDLAVTNVTSYKTVIGQGFSDNINVTVANYGNYTETLKVTVYANATSIASQNITLSIGQSDTITFVWNTTSFPMGSYTITVRVTLAPSETNTANNTYTYGTVKVTIPGDINGDWKVGAADLNQLGINWGLSGSQSKILTQTSLAAVRWVLGTLTNSVCTGVLAHKMRA